MHDYIERNSHIYATTCHETFVPNLIFWNQTDQINEVETTPSFCLRYSNASMGRVLANMSATCSLDGTYSNLTFYSSTFSHKKWYLIGMCFVLECITGFFEILMALVLSHSMEMGGEHFIWISCNVYIIQRSCLKHDATTTYSIYVVLNFATRNIEIGIQKQHPWS